MKRWLIAGLDSDDWEEGSKQSHHVGMGGRALCEFADGLSEEQCDRIAHSQCAERRSLTRALLHKAASGQGAYGRWPG